MNRRNTEREPLTDADYAPRNYSNLPPFHPVRCLLAEQTAALLINPAMVAANRASWFAMWGL